MCHNSLEIEDTIYYYMKILLGHNALDSCSELVTYLFDIWAMAMSFSEAL